jgi:hypothetical protein
MGETAILARKFLPNSCSAGAGAGGGMAESSDFPAESRENQEEFPSDISSQLRATMIAQSIIYAAIFHIMWLNRTGQPTVLGCVQAPVGPAARYGISTTFGTYHEGFNQRRVHWLYLLSNVEAILLKELASESCIIDVLITSVLWWKLISPVP